MTLLQLKSVSKSFGAIKALTDVELTIGRAEIVGLMGDNGAGKSTLVKLIPRFYDVTAGSVTIDGVDVRRLTEDSLLAAIGIVPQESLLLSGSVRDNVRYGQSEASDEQVIAAASAAQAHDFIARMPHGYDSRVEQRGANFSGGQRQRLALARALLLRPKLLILDDSTSAVDVETETLIQQALTGQTEAQTRIVVAQRISTVLRADKILVLDDGRIVAEGNHGELMRGSQVYREIYASQLGAGSPPPSELAGGSTQ